MAAARLFTEEGYEATTVEMIAAEAGVGPATVYNRFGTKSALVSAVIAENTQPLMLAVKADLRNRAPLRGAIESHLMRTAKFLSEHREIAHAILYALADDTRPQPAEGRPGYVCLTPTLQEPMELLVREGQASGVLKPKPSAERVAMLATNVLVLNMIALPMASPTRAAQGVIDLLLDGLDAGKVGHSAKNR